MRSLPLILGEEKASLWKIVFWCHIFGYFYLEQTMECAIIQNYLHVRSIQITNSQHLSVLIQQHLLHTYQRPSIILKVRMYYLI